MRKRLFDFVASAIGLFLLAPLLGLIAIAIKLDSAGPVFFRQQRVGRYGKVFRIFKFRTMTVDSDRHGFQVTVLGDPRITRVGRFLRKHKLDELPQLIDVFRGTMSLVGPRPEVPRYVAFYPSNARDVVLSVRPGITDRASIDYKDENAIMAEAEDPYLAYVNEILPVKIAYCMVYVQTRTFFGDIGLILVTLASILTGARPEDEGPPDSMPHPEQIEMLRVQVAQVAVGRATF